MRQEYIAATVSAECIYLIMDMHYITIGKFMTAYTGSSPKGGANMPDSMPGISAGI